MRVPSSLGYGQQLIEIEDTHTHHHENRMFVVSFCVRNLTKIRSCCCHRQHDKSNSRTIEIQLIHFGFKYGL